MKKTFAMLVTVGLFAASCKKDNLSTSLVPEEKTSRQDFLVVKDAQEFNQLLNTVPFLSQPEYDSWKKANGGFKSLYDRYQSLVKALDNVQSKEEALTLMKNESDYFYFDSLGRIESKVGWMISHLVNEDGIIQVNGAINKHINGELFFAGVNTKGAQSLLHPSMKFSNIKALAKDFSTQNGKTVERSIVGSNDNSFIGNVPIIAATHDYGFGDPGVGNNARAWGWRKGYFITMAEANKRKIFADLMYEITIVMEKNHLTGENYYYNALQKTYLKLSHQRKTIFGWNNYTTQATITNLTWSSSAAVGQPSIPGSIAPHTTTGSERSEHFYDIFPEASAQILEPGSPFPVTASYGPITLRGTSRIFQSFNLTASNSGGAAINNYSFSGDVSFDHGTLH